MASYIFLITTQDTGADIDTWEEFLKTKSYIKNVEFYDEVRESKKPEGGE